MATVTKFRNALQSRLTKLEKGEGLDKGPTLNQLMNITNMAKKSGQSRIESSSKRSIDALKKWKPETPKGPTNSTIKEASIYSTLGKKLTGARSDTIHRIGKKFTSKAKKQSDKIKGKIERASKNQGKSGLYSDKKKVKNLQSKKSKIDKDINKSKKYDANPKKDVAQKITNTSRSSKPSNTSSGTGAASKKKKMGLGKILAIGGAATAAGTGAGLYALNNAADKKQKEFRKTALNKKAFFITKLANTSLNSFINSFGWDEGNFTLDQEKFKDPSKKEMVYKAIRRQMKRYDDQGRLTPVGKDKLSSGKFNRIERNVDYK